LQNNVINTWCEVRQGDTWSCEASESKTCEKRKGRTPSPGTNVTTLFQGSHFGCVVQFRVESFGLRVLGGERFRVLSLVFIVYRFWFRIEGLVFRVSGVGFRVWGLGFRV
jgi:hypothetical protein